MLGLTDGRSAGDASKMKDRVWYLRSIGILLSREAGACVPGHYARENVRETLDLDKSASDCCS